MQFLTKTPPPLVRDPGDQEISDFGNFSCKSGGLAETLQKHPPLGKDPKRGKGGVLLLGIALIGRNKIYFLHT